MKQILENNLHRACQNQVWLFTGLVPLVLLIKIRMVSIERTWLSLDIEKSREFFFQLIPWYIFHG